MILIAGPCSAESRPQIIQTAETLAKAGVTTFRAGVWKPRTKPGGFEGIGAPALAWLAEAQRLTGIPAATEIANPRHLTEAVEAGISSLWIGARTAADPFAVQEIADAIHRLPDNVRSNLTVMVKNPVNPDIELWIGAIQRIAASGIDKIIAIHRGFSTYGQHLYRNEPRWAIPIELKRRLPHIPIVCDPSHIGGRSDLVGPIAQQALDMGFDGLMIEVHPSPADALSDAPQQLTPEALVHLLASLSTRRMPDSGTVPGPGNITDTRPRTGLGHPSPSLEEYRRRIDAIDDEILQLLAQRMKISREIGDFKRLNGIPVIQKERYNRLMHKRVEDAASLGLSPDFTRQLLSIIHEESVGQQL